MSAASAVVAAVDGAQDAVGYLEAVTHAAECGQRTAYEIVDELLDNRHKALVFSQFVTHLALVRKALVLRPDDGYITDSLGWVFYQQGKYEEALKWLLKALALVPDDPVINEHVGDAYLKLDNKSQALQYYQKSHALQDEDSKRQKIQTKIDALKTAAP